MMLGLIFLVLHCRCFLLFFCPDFNRTQWRLLKPKAKILVLPGEMNILDCLGCSFYNTARFNKKKKSTFRV